MYILLAKSTGVMASVWNMISLILIFVFVLVLAYIAAKLAGNYQNNVLNAKSNIKIIESFRLGGNKLIAIIKIGSDYYAIGVGKDEITSLGKLDKDALNLNESHNSGEKLSFKEVMAKMKNSSVDDREK